MSHIKREDDRYHVVGKLMISVIYYIGTCHNNSDGGELSCGEKNL